LDGLLDFLASQGWAVLPCRLTGVLNGKKISYFERKDRKCPQTVRAFKDVGTPICVPKLLNVLWRDNG
jgi:hypothetical protein